MKKRIALFLSTIMVMSIFMAFIGSTKVSAASNTCKDEGCSRTATSDRGYCSYHTCVKCNAHRIDGSSYCYTHSSKSQKSSYDDKVNKKVAKYQEEKKKNAPKMTCKESGCSRTATSDRGYCSYHTCARCNARRIDGSSYCYIHSSSNQKKSYDKKISDKYSGNKNKNSSYDSYDKGYEDVWLDDDFDWDRYCNDWDYASGVDDAMDEFDEDW